MSVGTSREPGIGTGSGPDSGAGPDSGSGDLRDGRGGHAGDSDADPAGPGTDAGIDPDDLPDGLVVADERGRVVRFNAAAERVTARRAADVLGRPLAEALPLEDLEGRRWWQLTDPYGGLATRTRQPERNLLLPGGREVLVSARYVRTEPTGPVRRVVVCLRDTEARRRTERSHAELIATVAHELRSPLTSVKGFTATLLAKWERFTDDQKRLMLETVDADADRVTRLIAELLDISRIDSGRLEVRRQPVDIGAAVGRHIQAYVAAGQPADRFLLRLEHPLPALWADPDKIDQVLSNLLENAVRHGEGTVTIEITPSASPPRRGGGRHVGHGERRGPRHPGGVHEPRLHPLLAGQQARRHGPRAVHRQGHRRGPRRRHHGRPRPRRRRAVPIYAARGAPGLPHLRAGPDPRAHPHTSPPLDLAFGTFASRSR